MEPTMTTFKFSKSLVAAAIALAVSASVTGVHAGANSSARVVKPLAGLSFPVGSKHAVGYFVPGRSGCELTLLVGESGDSVSDREKGSAPARLTTLVAAGRTARIDTAEGQSVEFFCSTGASFLTTRVIDRLAYSTVTAR
jgi:hypothetical protein